MEEEINIKDLVVVLWRKKVIIIIATLVFSLIGLFLYLKGDKTVVDDSNKKADNTIVEDNYDNNNDDEEDDKEFFYAITSFMFDIGKSETIEYDNEGGTVTTQTTFKLGIDDNVINNLNNFATSNTFINSVLEKIEFDEEEKYSNIKSNIIFYKNGPGDIINLIVRLNNKDNCIELSNMILDEVKIQINKLYKISDLIILDSPTIIEDEDELELISKVYKNDKKVENDKKGENDNSTQNGKTIVSKSKKKIVLFAALGFSLSCFCIIIKELFDETVKNETELEKATSLKTLTVIPKDNANIFDYIKLLRVNISNCKTILITSAEKGDGKTFISNKLAESFAKLGKKVILVDLVNNSNKLVSKYNGKGLTDYLASNDKIVEKYALETSIKNLSILFAGNNLENKTELFESAKMEETLDILEKVYDIVIIDSSNVIESADTLAVAKISKYTVLVTLERKTKLYNIIKAKNNIEDIGGNVIGTVLNNTLD